MAMNGESTSLIIFYSIFTSGGFAEANLPKAKNGMVCIEMCNTRVKNYAVAVCFIVVNSLTAPLVAAADFILLDMLAEEAQTI